MMQTVFNSLGDPQQIAQPLAQGGEGQIFPLVNRPEVLIKIYHPEVLIKRQQELPAKIKAMAAVADQFNNHAVSWPLLPVFDDQQATHWIGYAMRRAEGVPISRLAHPMVYTRSFPGLDRLGIVNYLLTILRSLQGLHQLGVKVGDYNFNNILCRPDSNQVTLIDCDSFQFSHQGRTFPCPVGSPDMTPVEHHGQDFSKVVRTEASECFSVAILLFKSLMLGRHPYDIVGGSDPVSNLSHGRFAYGTGNKGVPAGPWYNIWSHMPYRLKERFVTTFTHGARDPTQRPSLKVWIEDLELYKREIEKKWHDVAIRPDKPKPSQYRGTNSLAQG